MKEKIETLELKEKEKQEESKEFGEEIKKLQEEKSRVMEGDFKKLQEEENQCSKRLVKVNSMWQNKRDTLKSETKAHKQLEKQAEESKVNANKASDVLKRHDEKSKVSNDKLQELKMNKPWLWPASNPAGGRGGNGGAQGTNPWTKEAWNMTEQGAMIRQNPALARQMAQQAGQPVTW